MKVAGYSVVVLVFILIVAISLHCWHVFCSQSTSLVPSLRNSMLCFKIIYLYMHTVFPYMSLFWFVSETDNIPVYLKSFAWSGKLCVSCNMCFPIQLQLLRSLHYPQHLKRCVDNRHVALTPTANSFPVFFHAANSIPTENPPKWDDLWHFRQETPPVS